jgi:3-aminobutyryl-CoA ammonia-lyase
LPDPDHASRHHKEEDQENSQEAGEEGGSTLMSDSTDGKLGASITHRRYVPYSHAHYAGNLVDGAYTLGLFGDVATDLMIVTDGDEGLFASYSDIQFTAPVRAGDVLEVTATVSRVGRRSRELMFSAHVVSRGRPDLGEAAAEVLADPELAVSAVGTIVVPPPADALDA